MIKRFSEDVDLTYDIRAIAPDLIEKADSPWPTSRSQEKKWSKAIRQRLAELDRRANPTSRDRSRATRRRTCQR